ncbi:TetR/AcrR family transcriptional regulator [Reyranella soli]|uniref:TetR family transcriptional regulator n=1 Tax=Reyranella soli TaxID=1230389 RepID=A0A512NHJ5_9HYPH|nr:TetR/AcrR family transcriptional regulator [Reyranella soli]GEP58386.1 TetR family transcriptional regulator [Reyranella soli]
MNETAERLMDLAESHIRNAGYGGFSFRELAAEIGIKSASVHHHFPTKATMAAAVASRYADRFLAAVVHQPNETAEDAVAMYRSAFRTALDRDGRMCLCGVLGAEAGGLPPEVAKATRTFFRRCIEDLSARMGGGPETKARALQVMATLEGGMVLARALGSIDAFDQATASLAKPVEISKPDEASKAKTTPPEVCP